MRNLPFKSSQLVSIGVELELQLINPLTFDLFSRAKDLIKSISSDDLHKNIKPEVTQSMIEINSSVHQSPAELAVEFEQLHSALQVLAEKFELKISGGGTHPFQRWSLQKIFPLKRYKNLAHQYRYLSKRSTVFGQHIHIGCRDGDEAIYLTHALARFVPHFLALSASSPFYQGVDTGFNSSRSTIFTAFPQSGVIPYLLNWREFSEYYFKMRHLGIVQSMKDLYWDIRPKPEFGTVEIRVCDTPLTMKKAIAVAAYAQTLAHYLLQVRPVHCTHDLYYVYNYNRFQASRYGFGGDLIDAESLHHVAIKDDILATLDVIAAHSQILGNDDYLTRIRQEVMTDHNDALVIRDIYHQQKKSLPNVVKENCVIWQSNTDIIL
jgi:glutamate---cysteine ligase / carboxylate-amine ligase